jgi:hypothetical protein
MHNHCVRIILLSGCMSVIFYGTILTDTSAGPRQQKDQSSSSTEPTDRLKKPLPTPVPKNPIRHRTEQAPARAKAQEIPSVALQRPAIEGAIDAQKKTHRGHRQGKESKKAKAQAVIKPRADLMYHGILEDPSRYDPRQNRQTAGAPDPQTPELTHDHFQELDRNRDGKIDPVERAFGRLDMDRDLSTRQWQ